MEGDAAASVLFVGDAVAGLEAEGPQVFHPLRARQFGQGFLHQLDLGIELAWRHAAAHQLEGLDHELDRIRALQAEWRAEGRW